MPTTPNRDYPYPTLGDDNNPPADIQALALAVEADLDNLHSQVANVGALPGSGDFVGQRVLLLDTMASAVWTGAEWRGIFQSFTPAVTGLPLDAGNSWLRERIVGEQADVEFNLQASGAATATILLTPPHVPVTPGTAASVGVFTAQKGATRRYGNIRWSAGQLAFSTESATPAEENAAASLPFVWASGNTLAGRFSYRTTGVAS